MYEQHISSLAPTHQVAKSRVLNDTKISGNKALDNLKMGPAELQYDLSYVNISQLGPIGH